jgi:hypothetical protein
MAMHVDVNRACDDDDTNVFAAVADSAHGVGFCQGHAVTGCTSAAYRTVRRNAATWLFPSRSIAQLCERLVVGRPFVIPARHCGIAGAQAPACPVGENTLCLRGLGQEFNTTLGIFRNSLPGGGLPLR